MAEFDKQTLKILKGRDKEGVSGLGGWTSNNKNKKAVSIYTSIFWKYIPLPLSTIHYTLFS